MRKIKTFVDYCKYKNNIDEKYFLVSGWLLSKDKKEVKFEAMVNGKVYELEYKKVSRPDVFRKFLGTGVDEFINDSDLGFLIKVKLDETPLSFKLFLHKEKETKLLVDYSEKDIRNNESRYGLEYNIDEIYYKNNNEVPYIAVRGYLFSDSLSDVNLFAYADGKELSMKLQMVKRDDVWQIYYPIFSNVMPNNVLGFYAKCYLTENKRPEQFSIVAKTEKGTVLLGDADAKYLNKNQDKNTLEYCIDSCSYAGDKFLCEGWAVSDIGKEVRLSVVDEQGEAVEANIVRKDRTDIKAAFFINDDAFEKVGFFITGKTLTKKLYIILNDGFTKKKARLEVKQNKDKAFNSKKFKISKTDLRKGLSVLKNKGPVELYRKIKYRGGFLGQVYNDWFLYNRISTIGIEKQKSYVFEYNPKISIIVACYNTGDKYLKDMIESVLNQTYQNFELCISDGSDNDSVQNYIKEHYSNNEKIKYVRLDNNYGISGNMNAALELATGDFLALYDHDDFLEPNTFFECVKVLQGKDRADVVYTDEDRYDDESKLYIDPCFKTDFNVDLFRSHNFVTHFFMVNMDIVKEIGGMKKEYDGAQDYDFMFRVFEKTDKIKHVHKILYHWRVYEASTAGNPESKLYAYDAGKKALEDHYKRIGIDADVEKLPKPFYGTYKTTYKISGNPKVSILIPNMNQKNTLENCLNSIFEKNTYSNLEIVIVENNSTEEDIFNYYEELKNEHSNVKVIKYEGDFNYSKINNFGAEYCSGEYILFLNNDTELIAKDSISVMLGICQRKEVGAVGAKLLYADNTVQHAGVVIGFSNYAGHVFNGIGADDYGYRLFPVICRDYSAVTAACMMVSKENFISVGGFDEQFTVACNDVDLCLKLRKENKLVVYTPFSLWYHYESKSRGYDTTPEKRERFLSEVSKFGEKWNEILENGDPYYNNNFDINKAPYILK